MKLGALALFCLTGCGPIPDVARARAATDLQCAPEQIATYRAEDGSTVARGCGAWTQYECFRAQREFNRFGVNDTVVCVREAPAQINADAPAPALVEAPFSPPTPASAGSDGKHGNMHMSPRPTAKQSPAWNSSDPDPVLD
ncbi:MAG TPA: hypothetical protein VNW92_24760 [Polyangiaceae bacterium]|nr:hypothetical protein [Polyangiaceae bacterium]